MFEFLVSEEGGLVMSLCVRVDSRTPQGLHVLNRHSEDRQLVQLSTHGTAHRHHPGQLGDISVHIVSASLLNLAVVLPERKEKNKQIKCIGNYRTKIRSHS